MGKWGKNSVVAGVGLGCALFVMGVVQLGGGQRADAAAPERGWKPAERELLRQPVDAEPKAAQRADG